VETRRLIEGTCPECRDPLTEIQDDGIIEYRCLVGHRYSPEGLLNAHYDAEERALWAAVVGLEEALNLVQAVASHLEPQKAANILRDGENKEHQAKEIRRVLNQLKAYRLGSR
jgi:two-component system chemotaxis response regulator CheB